MRSSDGKVHDFNCSFIMSGKSAQPKKDTLPTSLQEKSTAGSERPEHSHETEDPKDGKPK